MKRNENQNRRLHQLINFLQIPVDTKKDLIYQYTEGRTESSADLTFNECERLIKDLTVEEAKKEAKDVKERQVKRRNIFKLFYDLGFINADMNNEEKNQHINDWIKKKTKFGKVLNYLSSADLDKLNNQLQAVRREYEKSN